MIFEVTSGSRRDCVGFGPLIPVGVLAVSSSTCDLRFLLLLVTSLFVLSIGLLGLGSPLLQSFEFEIVVLDLTLLYRLVYDGSDRRFLVDLILGSNLILV